jgi:transposase, IS30 family
MTMYNFKHLTLEQRMDIQLGLKEGLSLKALSERINKSPRTISNEIKTHLERKENNKFMLTQTQKHVCHQHLRYPYVCDACPFKVQCTSDRYTYDAKRADKAYHMTLSVSRRAIHLDAYELAQVDDVLKRGIELGQSPAHIKASHPELPITERTIYRYLNQRILSTELYKLRNIVKMKPRKKKREEPLDNGIYLGRTFYDYLAFIHQHPGMFTTQMDTVIGLQSDRKMILTLLVIELHLLVAFVVNKGAGGTIRGIQQLEASLGLDDFKRVFPVILTDRGSEFSNPDDIEKNMRGIKRTRLYYCDPLASYQKGAIESIHRVLRYVFPKGKSLDSLTQFKLDKAISNINNYRLRSNQFKTAYELTLMLFGEEVLKKLKIEAIDPDSIHLTPNLVR